MKKIQKCVDKNMILRYYIEADSQRGLTQVREDADCSLKTKQCNRNHEHMISSQMLVILVYIRMNF